MSGQSEREEAYDWYRRWFELEQQLGVFPPDARPLPYYEWLIDGDPNRDPD